MVSLLVLGRTANEDSVVVQRSQEVERVGKHSSRHMDACLGGLAEGEMPRKRKGRVELNGRDVVQGKRMVKVEGKKVGDS